MSLCSVRLLLFCVLIYFSALPLGADQPRRVTLREQTLTADCILHGKVIAGHSRVEHGRIYTYYELSTIGGALKGGADGRAVVRTPGGVVGLAAYVVPGAPEFTEREEVVLFLNSREGAFELDGLARAVYRVAANHDGLPEVLPNVELDGPVLSAEGHVFPPGRPLPLDAFLRAVRGYLGRSYADPVRELPADYFSDTDKGGKKVKVSARGPDLAAGNVQAGYSRILGRPVDIFWDLSRDYGPVRGGRVHWSFNPDSIAGKSPWGVTPDQALAAVEWSFEQWNAINTASIKFESDGQRRDIPDHKLDLVNVVTFADSEYTWGIQKDAIASARPFVLTRRTWVGPEGLDWDQDGRIDFPDFPEGIWEAGTILDCDLRWDVGGPYADTDFVVDNTPGALSMQAVFNHEIGHLAGLVHSPIRDLGNLLAGRNSTPTMFSVAFPNAANGTGNPMTSLERDDIVSLSMLYPAPEFGATFGVIEGSVVRGTDAKPARGNFVVALSAEGAPYGSLNDAYHRAVTAVGVFSDQQGKFRIPGLPPGDYVLALQPMDDVPTGTNRNAFNTLVSRFGDTEFIWDEFYNGPREGAREADPLDYELLSVSAAGTLSGIRFVTNFYPEGRERLRRMFGERDYIVAANQLRLSSVSSSSDMVARRFPQVFKPPYRLVGASCDFASITAPPEGAQVTWPEIILAVSDPADPSRPDLSNPIAVLREFQGNGTLLGTDPLPFRYPLTVDRPGELWLVVRSPQGRFNAFHNIDILGAGQDELQVDESFVSFSAGASFNSVMNYGISWRMGVELEGASALEPLAEPKLLKSESIASGGVRLHFAGPRSLSGLKPESQVTLSMRYLYATQPYPAASLLQGAIIDQLDGSAEFNLVKREAHGDSSLYRLSGLRILQGRLAGSLARLSDAGGPPGSELSFRRISGRASAGLEGLWEDEASGALRLDLHGAEEGLTGALIWPSEILPEADATLIFRGLPGDTVLVVDSLPSIPAGFELVASDDSGRRSLTAVLGLGNDPFEPNERINDARQLSPSVAWPPQLHGLSAVRGVIASTKNRSDYDFFRFPVHRGDSVVIDVDAVSSRPFRPASGLDAYLEAFDSTGARFKGADGREVLSDDDNGLDPFATFVSPRDATLYLKLLEAGVAYGDPGGLTGHNMFYELRVSLLPRRGDIVRDGFIRMDDVLAAIEAAENPSATDPQSLFAADYDGNGQVTLSDAAAVFRLALDDPLARPGPSPAAAGSPEGISLRLDKTAEGASLHAEPLGSVASLLWLEFFSGPALVREGRDLPRGCEIRFIQTGDRLHVLLDLGRAGEKFRGGELLDLSGLSDGGRFELARATAGSPGMGEATVLISGSAAPGAEIPSGFSLEGNRPNPFNPSTTIAYSVPGEAPGEVILAVYDIRGRRVRQLVNSVHAPGNYRVVWEGTDSRERALPSGVYFCRMSAPGFSAVRKMVLLK